MTRAAELLRLQEADTQIAALRADIAEVEAALRGDPELERQLTAVRSATEESTNAAATLSEAEQQLAALERRAKTLDRTLYGGSVRNPNELVEMQRELEVLRAQVSTLEDTILERMDTNDSAASAAAKAQAVADEMGRKRADQEVPRRRRRTELRSRLDAATSAREAVAESIAAADLGLYARVASRHQPAVVSIKGDACGGCHLPLSNEERRAVRAGEGIVQCSSCDRILVP